MFCDKIDTMFKSQPFTIQINYLTQNSNWNIYRIDNDLQHIGVENYISFDWVFNIFFMLICMLICQIIWRIGTPNVRCLRRIFLEIQHWNSLFDTFNLLSDNKIYACTRSISRNNCCNVFVWNDLSESELELGLPSNYEERIINRIQRMIASTGL